MQRIQVISILLLAVYSLSSALPAQAAADTGVEHVLISEIQVINGDAKSEDFVELYNPTDDPVDLTGWRLQYKAATNANCDEDWSNRIKTEDDSRVMSGKIQPRGFLLVASEEFQSEFADLNYDETLSSGILDTKGHLRLTHPTPDPDDPEETIDTTVDMVGWGEEAECAQSSPVDVSEAAIGDLKTWSMKRKFNNDDQIQDTGNNAEDFQVEEPNPQSTPPPGDGAPEEPEDEDPGDEPEEEPPEEPEDPVVYPKLDITEVLPDPDKPQLDAEDEFVELYNPNEEKVNLKGYTLKTGSSLQTVHTFDPATVQPKSYRAFYSRGIKIGLVNSGGKAQLLDPGGEIVSELVSYPKAETGKSWAQVGSKWQWTDRVTPSAANESHTAEPKENTASSRSGTSSATRLGPFAKVNITELLPDPASPQTDADDEYVELYNPNDYTVDLTGYVIQTGSNFRSKHTIDGIKIEANQYIAVFNSAANLSLTNKGGAARLLDPAGKVISTTDAYPKAETGAAWAQVGSKWQWTSTPTPAAKNVLTSLETDNRVSTAAAQTSASQNRARSVLASPATVQTTATTNAIVAGALGSALLYGLYEWRGDLRNIIERFRRHRSLRRKGRV